MAQQQQNITIAAPGFEGLNTEDSPLQQDPAFCVKADNAVLDKSGRIGARKAWGEYTTANNLTYSVDASTARTEEVVHRLGSGLVNGVRSILCSVEVTQFDTSNVLLQSDYFVCELNTTTEELDEITLPTLTDSAKLVDCQFVAFNDAMYVFSKGNECMKWDGTTMSLLFTGTVDTDYIPPTDDTGVLASAINGDVATAAYGRLWVTGVDGDYQNIYYSDLLLSNQWYDGRAAPEDSQNTGGIINVSQYWPAGRDRIVSLVAHNGFLIVFGRQSMLVYSGVSEDPAALTGATLSDTITNIGCVSRDAVTVVGSDVLFLDDTGVRSLGRTIQEKSAPIGDLTYNIRSDISRQIDITADKSSISMSYWPDEALVLVLFSAEGLGYVVGLRSPSKTGGMKITRWVDCRFNRALYFENADKVRILLATNQDSKGLTQYTGFNQYDGGSYQFKYLSTDLSFGQSVSEKFIKQIDYTLAAIGANAQGYAEWGYVGSPEYTRLFTVKADNASLYGEDAEYNIAEFAQGLTPITRYRINAKGSGSRVVIGCRVDILGNGCSLQEINVQTLLGRIT